MKKIIFILSIFTSTYFMAQKLYIWCPPEQKVKPRTSFLDKINIDVVIFDGRTISNKVRDKCDSKTVTDDLANYIKRMYPSANINILNEEAYYNKAQNDKVTIKIAISAYHAGFGTDITLGIGSVGGNFTLLAFPKGEWNALGLSMYRFSTLEIMLRKGCKLRFQKWTRNQICLDINLQNLLYPIRTK